MRRNKLVALLLAIALCIGSLEYVNEETSLAVAGSSAVAGAVIGGGAFMAFGTGGVALASAVAGIGAAPFITIGAVAGLAGYGLLSAMNVSTCA